MSKKPKILFIGPTPPPYSGPELSMQQFLESDTLNNAFNIKFLKTNFRSDNTKKGKLDLSMLTNFFIFFTKLFKLLITNRPKCVYYPITPTQIGWIGRDVWTILLSKLFGAKVIIHLRGSHFKLNFTQFNPIIKKLVGYSLKKVDCAIVQANYLKDQFHPFVPESKMAVLYQAMDTEQYAKSDDAEIQQGKILVMGHMTKAKGFTDILKIIPQICQEFPFATFYFAGNIRKGERGVFYNQFTGKKITYEDPFEAEAKIVNSDYKNNYVNLGIINGADKMKHLRTTDIFLTASYSEGFSRSLLEAMSMGKPTVFTPVGAHREVFKDQLNGFSFVPGDLEQLKIALKAILSDYEKRRAIGEYNRAYVVSDFSIEKISKDFKTIISNTLT
ncbi:glycosyltransferase family 4 protein [Winogradskyella echinorum]|uniref:Glycosyltransferase family 4 protein n=1 Tax=Winogradskyella echinorum TaxID=538189 RepID=A0ABR6XYS9_9FLAO|nr:glycosyltransferase family 4 protein [Winogradskyella echinorum]MBC3845165.1 glycosyltransferase family 4 protein [Winogradskyella echinorum]MBC5749513.1 glycosyltransferase family 4 protein [Winogradskyella echinorum]